MYEKPYISAKHTIMNIKIFGIALLVALGLSACNNDSKRKYRNNSPAVQTPSSVSVPLPQSPGDTGAQKTVEIALNPEHGMPGHRCEIPVGAPLTSNPEDYANNPNAPGASAQPQMPQGGPVIETKINPSAPSSPATSSGGSKRLNPAHGEPGHDCNIPVGDPLPN